VLVLPGVESHAVPSCEKGSVMAPSLLDPEWPQEGAFMSINAMQRTAGPPRFQMKAKAVGGAPAAADGERWADMREYETLVRTWG